MGVDDAPCASERCLFRRIQFCSSLYLSWDQCNDELGIF
ncbi:Hypothetical Protein XCAW_01052 [Xanthomonas citri subsp. citri Aw12879]|nr:Hypothetical Protein XCAW_01052 [Xanthomonas citri subsp. citri Aw12879]